MQPEDHQLPSPPPEDSASKPVASNNGKRLLSGDAPNNHENGTTNGNIVDSTSRLNRVDPNDDLFIRLLAQTAVMESQDSHILSPEEVDELKNEHLLLLSMIESTKRKLVLEQKVKQAAQSLYRLETAANKRQRLNSSLPTASTHLETAQKKCDEINAELWKIASQSMDIERKLLNHNAAVLGLGMTILEKKALENNMTDEFGEGHLYASVENEEQPSLRFSVTEKTIAPVIPPEFLEGQSRLRDLTFTVAAMTRSEVPTPGPDSIVGYVDQLEKHIGTLTDSHAKVNRKLQTNLSESQRMVSQLKLRERDQSAAITDHIVRNEDLQRRLTQTQEEFDRVQNELEEQTELIEALKQDVKTAKEEARIVEAAAQGRHAESLQREENLRRSEAQRFTDELAQKHATITELEQFINDLRAQHESTEANVALLRSNLDEQSRQHGVVTRDLEIQLVMLKSENTMLKAELDGVLGSRQQRAEEARLQKQLEEQREKFAQVSQAEGVLLQEVESLKQRNSQLVHDLQLSESERVAAEDSLSRQITTLEQQLAESSESFTIVDRASPSSSDSSREKELEARCNELQSELSSILDDFECLTSRFIDHESFRQTLESQVDALRAQCHTLQTELAEEKVRMLGRNNDTSSPIQGGIGSAEQTSTTTLRNEFRKMVAQMRNEHIATLKVEYDERRRLEAVVREMKKEKDRERYGGKVGESDSQSVTS